MEAYVCIDQLQLAPTPSALQCIHQWLHHLQQSLQLSTDLVFRMDLVLNELIPNILEHGKAGQTKAGQVTAGQGATDLNASDCKDCMWVRLLKNARGYALEISDGGPAFNPLQQAYTPATDLQSASVSGRGIHLVKTFTDQQYYLYDAGRNTLLVTFYSALPD